jgi:cytochrome c2
MKCIVFALCLIIGPLTDFLYAETAEIEKIDLINSELLSKRAAEKIVEKSFPPNPVFKNSCKHRGFKLSELLTLFKSYDSELDQALRFTGTDGYSSIVRLKDIHIARAFLAGKPFNRDPNCIWDTIPMGKEKLDPAPFALIWNDWQKSEVSLPYPYSVASVELGLARDFYGATYPVNLESAMKGFNLFRTKCLSCHSVNLVGGIVGPELNVPKNVTEYWSKENFINFVANPQSFRWRSKMQIPKLPKNEIEEIHHYLSEMKKRKLCSTEKECAAWELQNKSAE